jgi:hypothetical protein
MTFNGLEVLSKLDDKKFWFQVCDNFVAKKTKGKKGLLSSFKFYVRSLLVESCVPISHFETHWMDSYSKHVGGELDLKTVENFLVVENI